MLELFRHRSNLMRHYNLCKLYELGKIICQANIAIKNAMKGFMSNGGSIAARALDLMPKCILANLGEQSGSLATHTGPFFK